MIPINYLSRQEAIEVIAAAKFAGVPDRGAVIEARQKGVDAADGPANDEAIAELWRAVDEGTLEVIAHGPGDRWLKMSPEETGQVPLLRAPRGGDFTFLKPGNPFHDIAVSKFGSRLGLVSLMFPKLQVEKVARLTRRRRRQSLARSTGNHTAKQPSRKELVLSIVRKMIEDGRWNPTISLIALTRLVERSNNWGQKVPSEDSVTGALDQIYEETRDRRFQRTRRRPRGASS